MVLASVMANGCLLSSFFSFFRNSWSKILYYLDIESRCTHVIHMFIVCLHDLRVPHSHRYVPCPRNGPPDPLDGPDGPVAARRSAKAHLRSRDMDSMRRIRTYVARTQSIIVYPWVTSSKVR